MLPLLYETTEKVISSESFKYMGRITECQNCVVTEELEGDYIAELTVLATDEIAEKISYQKFIKIKPNPYDAPQFFEIYDITEKNESYYIIKAKHIKHNLYNNVVKATSIVSSSEDTAQEFWDTFIVDGCVWPIKFNFLSKVKTEKIMVKGISTACTLGEILGNNEGSITDVYGGEIKFDNFNITHVLQRNRNINKILRWNGNLSSLEKTISSEEMYTHIIAAAIVKDENPINPNGEIQLVSNPYIVENSVANTTKVLFLDASNWEVMKRYTVDSMHQEPNSLYEMARQSLFIYATSFVPGGRRKAGQPSISITIDYRSELDDLTEVQLGDTIHIVVDDKGNQASARIIKIEYDALMERWKSIELGDKKVKITDYIN